MVTISKPRSFVSSSARTLEAFSDERFQQFLANYQKLSAAHRSVVMRMMRCFVGELTKHQRARLIGDVRRLGVDLNPGTIESLQAAKVRAHRIPDTILRQRRGLLHRTLVRAFATRFASAEVRS